MSALTQNVVIVNVIVSCPNILHGDIQENDTWCYDTQCKTCHNKNRKMILSTTLGIIMLHMYDNIYSE